MSETTLPVIDYDGKWKKLIEQCPRLFIDFFLKEIYDAIDFSIKPKMLMQDLAKIISTPAKKGDKVTDLVMEVHLKNGQKRLLHIHIEVQSAWVDEFGEKMYVPFYRLRDKYRQEVTAFALFVGETLPKNPGEYRYEFGKTFVHYRYPYYICKNQEEAELLKVKNPFAIAVLACKFLADFKKKPDTPRLLAQKKRLVEEYILQKCRDWGFGNDVIFAICDFILNIVILPEDANKDFINQFQNRAKNMSEITLDPYTPEMVRKIVETGLLKKLNASEKKRAEEKKAARLKFEKIKKEMEAIKVVENKKVLAAEEAARKKILTEKEAAKAAKVALAETIQKSIISFSEEAGFDNAKIAEILGLELEYVAKIVKARKDALKK